MSTSEYSESPRSAVNPEAVQRAKREIQGIVRQIAELSRQDHAPDRFYEEFLNNIVSALAAGGGAVWTLSDARQLQLTYQINLRETGLIQNPIGQEQHGRLLSKVMTENEGVLVPPHSGAGGGSDQDDEHAAANPTDFLLVLAPVFNDEGVQGVVEVFQRPGARQATQHGYLRFLLQTCELAGDYLRSRRLKHLTNKQSLWEQLESFTRTAHQKLDVRETAYTIANEGRRLIGCDRVTVAVLYGNRVVLEAISGQDTFDKRSNVARLLTNTAKAVSKTAEDVWYTGDTTSLAPQVEKSLDAYVDESHTKAMAILPLVVQEDEDAAHDDDDKKNTRNKPPQVLGALIVEQMVDSHLADGFRQRVDVVRGHSTTAIANALEHEGLFLMPLWKAIGKAMWIFRGRTLPKTLAVTAIIAGLLAYGLLWTTDFKLQGDGSLQPVVVRSVFARVPGEVDEVLVDQKSQVTAGQTLLTLRSIDLDKELEQVRGELNETSQQRQSLQGQLLESDIDPADQLRIESEARQVASRQRGLQQQFELLQRKKAMLVIASPITGEVITSNVREQLLGRPVNPGPVILEVADTAGDWEVELLMPEKRMAHVNRERARTGEPLRVEFIPRSQPESTLTGTVIQVDTTAEARGEEGNTVKLRVKLDDQQAFRDLIDTPVVGAEVTASVYCGEVRVAYAWLHDLVDAVRTHVVFPYLR